MTTEVEKFRAERDKKRLANEAKPPELREAEGPKPCIYIIKGDSKQ